jgi:hypothetical protein
VSCARAVYERQGVDDLCVSARHTGVTPVCVFTIVNMRTVAVGICNVVASLDYSRPRCNLNRHKLNMTKSR